LTIAAAPLAFKYGQQALHIRNTVSSSLVSVRRQCVYSLTGYDSFTRNGKDLVQLWGVARDLAAAPRLRSTGLAVDLMNQSIQEELHEVGGKLGPETSGITAVAFRGAAGWSAALVSSRPDPVMVRLSFPSSIAGGLPSVASSLSGSRGSSAEPSISSIPIETGDAHSIRVSVPARGLVVVLCQPQARVLSAGGAL